MAAVTVVDGITSLSPYAYGGCVVTEQMPAVCRLWNVSPFRCGVDTLNRRTNAD